MDREFGLASDRFVEHRRMRSGGEQQAGSSTGTHAPSAHIGTYRAVSGHWNRLSEALDNAGYVRG